MARLSLRNLAVTIIFQSESPRMNRPNLSFMMQHPAHWVALGLGSGLSPKAPGTVGTLWAWAVYAWLITPWLSHLGVTGMGVLLVMSFLLGWWACTVTARHMGLTDSSHMVWDEVVAFWALLWLASATTWPDQLALFVLFRLFDSVKVGPVAWADQAFKGLDARGGWGVMFDDLVAAALAALTWWAGIEVWHGLF